MTTAPVLRYLATAVALALMAAGCGGDDKSAEQTPPTTRSATTSSGDKTDGAPVVKLLEAGAEPRKKLRLALVEGSTVRAALTMKFGIQLEADGKPLPSSAIPPIRVDLGTTVNEVKDSGDARIGFAYERIEVVDDGSADKSVVEQVRQSGIDKLANLKGETTVTRRGVAKDSSIDLPEDLPPALEQVVGQLSQQTGNLTVPFPEEAVGEGAKWNATTSVDAGGIEAELVLTYTLRQLDGDQYVLDVSYEQTADRQKADLPGVPEGTEVELRDLLVKGTGEIAGNVASVLPTLSTLSAAGTVNMDVKSATEQGKLVQKLSLEVTFETLPAS